MLGERNCSFEPSQRILIVERLNVCTGQQSPHTKSVVLIWENRQGHFTARLSESLRQVWNHLIRVLESGSTTHVCDTISSRETNAPVVVGQRAHH